MDSDYIDLRGYKPTYYIGDRVFGHWNKIPFVGTVGNDRIIDNTGPHLTIQPDLPIMFKGKIHNIITVKHRAVKRLVPMFEEDTKPKAKPKAKTKPKSKK